MWARIQNGTVAELTDIDPSDRFHPSIKWVACSDKPQPGWYFDGEQFVPPPLEPIEDLAAHKCAEIDAARNHAFTKGLPYDIAGTSDVIQTRAQDQVNLLALLAKAQRLIDAGDIETCMTFRGLSNVNLKLTAEEIYTLTLTALKHIEEIYQHSWALKDIVQHGLQSKDRKTINSVTWETSTGWMN